MTSLSTQPDSPAASTPRAEVPLWLHGWAILTVVLTVVLLTLGAMVTTFRVGMADPVWPTRPLFLFFIDWQEPSAGFLIEHSHRLAGWAVGACSIVLAVGLWLGVRSGPLRWLGWTALLVVTIQGLLGGFRVRLHVLLGPNLALIHGVFAQVVFSVLVCTAVLTSRKSRSASLASNEANEMRLPGLCLVGLLFTQLVWGAMVRQDMGRIAPRLHIFTAFAVIVAFCWFALSASRRPRVWSLVRTSLFVLVGLLCVQVLLGVESLMSKFAYGFFAELQRAPTLTQATLRTAHVVVGAIILATAVSAYVRIAVAGSSGTDTDSDSRQSAPESTPRVKSRILEGVTQ